MDPAGYYIQASEAGGEPPGRWWGPGAKALGLGSGEVVDRGPYELVFGERKAPDGTSLGRPPGDGRKAAGLYDQLLAAEPHATAERKRELRLDATRQARQSPLFFDLTLSLSKSVSIFHASPGENALLARETGDKDCPCVTPCVPRTTTIAPRSRQAHASRTSRSAKTRSTIPRTSETSKPTA